MNTLVDTVDTLESLDMIKDGMNVLDIGCFIGSWPMTMRHKGYKLNYYGLDVNKVVIAKCRNNMPEYRFEHLDIYNPDYNPYGHFSASKTTLPIESNWADLIICHSLFTHLGDFLHAKNYMNEIKRILRPGAKLWITFFSSPPNEPDYSTKRTVYRTDEIDTLIDGFGVLYKSGGETQDYNDQVFMALLK